MNNERHVMSAGALARRTPHTNASWLVIAMLAAAMLSAMTLPGATLMDDAARMLRATAIAYLPAPAPSAEVAQLADAAGLSDTARDIFYAAQPVIAERDVVRAHCHAPYAGDTVELGCLATDGRIYILKIASPGLSAEMAVVAAHETLHATYQLYTTPERQALAALLEAAAARVRDPGLAQTLAQYAVLEPGERANELFAILGTEYGALDPALEAHYARYFTNRAIVTTGTARFKHAYAELDATLKDLRSDMELLQRALAESLQRGNTRAYNDAAPRYAAVIALYNQTLAQNDPFARSLGGRPIPAPTP